MARSGKTMNDIPTNFDIASSEKEVARLPKNVAVSDFESIRKEHIHKQINFIISKWQMNLKQNSILKYKSIIIKIVEKTSKKK